MNYLRIRLFFLASTLSLISFNSEASSLVIGSNDGANCYPFSCGASDGLTTYQEIYSSNEFSGQVRIDGVKFFQASGGLMDSANYTLKFSYTPRSVGSLDATNPDNNIGSGLQIFGNYTLSGMMPSVLQFTAGTPFIYDSSNGNLLMTVVISNLIESHNYESSFQADFTGLTTSRAYFPSGAAELGALVTEFDLSPVNPSTVPIPGSFWLVGSALAGLAKFSRKKSNKSRR